MKKIVVLILISLFIATGCSVKKVKELTVAEKISNEFQISKDNPFVYAKYKEVIDILNSEGIVFLANPDDEGSLKAIKIINKIALENNIKKIYYYNPNKIKKDKKKYNELLDYFKDYIVDENHKHDFSIPILFSVKDGVIVGYSNYFSKENQLSEEELTKKVKRKITSEYSKILNYQKCSNCN